MSIQRTIASVLLLTWPAAVAAEERYTFHQITHRTLEDPVPPIVVLIGISDDGEKVSWSLTDYSEELLLPRPIFLSRTDGSETHEVAQVECVFDGYQFCTADGMSGDARVIAMASCADPLGSVTGCQFVRLDTQTGVITPGTRYPVSPDAARRPELSADGSTIVYIDADGIDIDVMHFASNTWTQYPRVPFVFLPGEPQLTAAGDFAVWSAYRFGFPGTAGVLGAETTGSSPQIFVFAGPNQRPFVDMSREGRVLLIASVGNYGGQNPQLPDGTYRQQLFVLRPGSMRQLTDASTVRYAAISAQSMTTDGSVAFAGICPVVGTCSTKRIDTATGIATDLVPSGAYLGEVHVSADGSTFAWVSGDDFTGENPDHVPQLFTLKIESLPENAPPDAEAGVDVRTECESQGQSVVTLSGAGSSDPDSSSGTNDDITLYEWFEDFGGPTQALLGTGAVLRRSFALGVHAVTLRVTDAAGASDADELQVSVSDTTPPELSVSLSPSVLFPPNHRMVPITATVTARDACGSASAVLVAFSSSEDDDAPGTGDGQTTGDIQGVTIGSLDLEFVVRAERAGTGPGRVYSAVYSAEDGRGNAITRPAAVLVPHDQGGPVDPLTVTLWKDRERAIVQWTEAPGARFYNVIRGDVGKLRSGIETVLLGPVSCLASRTTATTAVDADAPP
ncbi:MAG TPA: hypothetical protein VJ826_09505, partial [Candidatus Polarisedimenticolaceae bacterium]|nr:hypothetical protein [Candidatus Polarisedimenticolaceae bacterium]